jgi:pimeloyl-ACP methyl ester carboxylesterase
MKTAIFAGAACALSLLTPAFCAPASYEVGSLRVEQRGDSSPPIILIPGLASGPWVWSHDTDRLAKEHVVYLLTLPGFDGHQPDATATFDSLVRDLGALIESRRIAKPVLVGHSMGGTLSLAFAAGHSDAIAGVITIDGLPVFPGTEHMADRTPLAAQARAQFENQTPEQFAAAQKAYMQRFGVIDTAVADRLASHSGRSNPRATGEWAAQVLLLDLRPRMKDIRVPVVEISPFYEPDFAAMGVNEERKAGYYRMLLPGIEQLEVVSISPARHFVMFDQPEKFSAALGAALGKMIQPGVPAHAK